MLNTPETRSAINWPVAIAAVLLVLAAVQMVRVNLPRRPASVPGLYTQNGPILTGPVAIAADDFYSVRIDLNRTAMLTGTFRTASLSVNVEAIVLTEDNFYRWRDGVGHESVARTNKIPGGRLNLRLEPGTYFLVLDNRGSAAPAAPVAADFAID